MSPPEVAEGAITLQVPEASHGKGPGVREGDVFYNPAMALARDVSLAVVAALHAPGWRVLDGLAASGARGLRLAAAFPDLRVQLNDWSGDAVARIHAHAEANGLADRVEVTRRNLGALLWEARYDHVDVDPFGSPSAFLDAACYSLRRGGLLGFAATDTAALNAVYPEVCRRRYLATPSRSEFGHETALRILAGFALRQGAKHDLALRPVAAHATDHYYRLYLEATPGAGRANAAMDVLGYADHCATCGARGLHRDPRGDPGCDHDGAWRRAGPLWTGPLGDREVLEGARDAIPSLDLARPREARHLLEALRQEADAPPLFFDVHEAASRAGVSAPPREAVDAALRERGFAAAGTHVTPLGLRTDATAAELTTLLRDLEKR